MKIILGGLELRSEEQPESIPLGGEQSLYLEEFPGGNVGMQNMGPRFREITWSGWFEGLDAYDRMLKIEKMRQDGKIVEFQTEKYTLPVAIKSFTPDHRKNEFIPFSITLKHIFSREKIQSKDAIDTVAESQKKSNAGSSSNSQTYTVVSGDTLSKIALRFLGNANKYTQIYNDNKAVLKYGPHKIYPGMQLVIKK